MMLGLSCRDYEDSADGGHHSQDILVDGGNAALALPAKSARRWHVILHT